ncbi:MAG TPA: RnfH family protein [Burkholderiales bacterium]|nr:RnfH family protein [Burkholderiales bacterium]
MAATIIVEVVYALPDAQTLLALAVPAGSTASDAVRLSGILEKHPEIVLATAKLGVFGKHVKADAPLRDRDRVEIYRPLVADPKEVRRRRATEGKTMKKGGGTADDQA